MKAVSLFSGGLDSQLAVLLIQKQGITVIGVNFITPFFAVKQSTLDAAETLGIELLTIDISAEYMGNVLINPVYGYGQHMNPCIDCHAFMLKKARSIMDETGAAFLITGEVLGQRPMSQNRSALQAVEKLSGQAGLIVRPLSALLLEPTIPENTGCLDRSQLLDISGRSRKRQMELAESFNLKEYPSPAGGCLLTDANYSRRLRYLLSVKPDAGTDEIKILSWGRNFGLEGALLIIGRNHKENQNLLASAIPGDLLLTAPDYPGPVALLKTADKEPDLQYIAAIVARYGDGKDQPRVMIKIFLSDGTVAQTIPVSPLNPDDIPAAL
ncbi:MAG TPA: tRNA 4-thiouridine(8) synthase ThiI [Syntrophomonadaceae bacterium]|nr:tRNA 4-thiouridine(8) synthase ThiI [Syntrophomonadaceae bacterium]HNX28681.1 tRNA 4-thiouridine(8) synthase ThiI [Syntrophomonadaceae bacterium]HPR93521.1 tRNA 4-thiouridine(8) synthase ThiI [Syntrophomonadaceae bacterium]